ncbi:TetR/AcrR family transcriptional regulator [Streptomyces sp. NPDC058642]|uniref:TetR/AcrR family transcriptional regulator n=1 Tax=Streptomyces sp. NPDC058642 TaxID=3346572 RepID=UPI00364CB6B6
MRAAAVQPQRSARRPEIVRAALEVIAERGYRGASLAAVAERVGLTQQGLLHHFPTKEARLVAVLKERDQWDAVPDTQWRIESVTGGHPARGYFTERYAQVRESMAAVLRAEYGDRLPNGLTPGRTAPLLVAVMDGLQYQWLLDPESVDMPGAFRDFLSLLSENPANPA